MKSSSTTPPSSGGSSAGVLLGVHIGPENNATDEAGIQALDTQLGRNIAIDSDYVDWNPNSSPNGFPNMDRLNWDKQNGFIAMESWRTDFAGADPSGGCATAADIIAGKYDAQLVKQADLAKSYGAPILVRWHYEMTDNADDTCFNNGQTVKKNFAVAGPNYVNSWKHIVDIFRQQGATNVEWVWGPSAGLFTGDNGSLDATDWKLFYPGNDYVDWISDDHYNKDTTLESYATDPNIANFYSQVSGLGKPLMQAETGAYYISSMSPDPQTEWLQTAFNALPTKYPDFKAFIYWDGTNGTSGGDGSSGDGGYGLRGGGLAAFKTSINSTYYQATQLPFLTSPSDK
jgi:beta-mannanase